MVVGLGPWAAAPGVAEETELDLGLVWLAFAAVLVV